MDKPLLNGTECLYIHQFYAMASPFSLHLVGTKKKYLRQVGRQMEEIVRQKEQLLSKYSPASELWRINREATKRPVQCSLEMFEILSKALWAFEFSQGFFDIGWERANKKKNLLTNCLRLNPKTRTVSFAGEHMKLDFGGLGKGYALDRVAEELESWGIHHFLLNGGSSSAVARGRKPSGEAWTLRYQDSKEKLALRDQAFSCSGKEDGGYSVLGPDGFSTEILSTALLEMEAEQVKSFCEDLREEFHIFKTSSPSQKKPIKSF